MEKTQKLNYGHRRPITTQRAEKDEISSKNIKENIYSDKSK